MNKLTKYWAEVYYNAHGQQSQVYYAKDVDAHLAAQGEEIEALKEWKHIILGTGTDQEAVIRLAATEYTKTIVESWKQQVATLQAELEGVRRQYEDEHFAYKQLSQLWNKTDLERDTLQQQLAEYKQWYEAGQIAANKAGLICSNAEAIDTLQEQLAAREGHVKGLVEALRPYQSGEDWGKWLAWIVEGAPTREQGIMAAKVIVHCQNSVDKALAKPSA